MAKPIFITKLPIEFREENDRIKDLLSNQLYDYHVIVIIQESDKIEFEVFYEKDFKEVDFEYLENLIKNTNNE